EAGQGRPRLRAGLAGWRPLGAEAVDQAVEAVEVAERRAVAGADQRRLQLRELADGQPVLSRVRGEDARRLADPGAARDEVDVVDHVAADRDAVGVAQGEGIA